MCKHCGELANTHDPSSCSNKIKCINCGEEHVATSRSCPVWKGEKEIITIKYRESLSFPEARKIVESRQTLYSTITKTHTSTARQVKDAFAQTVDVGVQTQTQKKPETNCMPQKQTPSNVKPPQKPLVNKHPEKPDKSAPKSPSKSPRQVLSDRLPEGSDD